MSDVQKKLDPLDQSEALSDTGQSSGLFVMGCLGMLAVLTCLIGGAGLYMLFAFRVERARLTEEKIRSVIEQDERARANAMRAKELQMQGLQRAKEASRLREIAEREKRKEQQAVEAKRLAEAARKAKSNLNKDQLEATKAKQKKALEKRIQSQQVRLRQKLMVETLGANNDMLKLSLKDVGSDERKKIHVQIKKYVSRFVNGKVELEELEKLHKVLKNLGSSKILTRAHINDIKACLN
jgi:hypothetical protein